jgi:NTP pyrophosphatase (non-canonical NTP hydrolase)
MTLFELVREYYDKRGLKWPTFDDAMKFVQTEIGEIYELDLARIGGYKRNHPQNKPQFSKEALAEELGDAILMLLVAGIVEEVNPLEAMENKMKKRMEDFRIKQEREEAIKRGELVVTYRGPDFDWSDGTVDNYNYTQDDLNFDAERERRWK